MKNILKKLLCVMAAGVLLTGVSCSQKKNSGSDVELIFWHGVESPESTKLLEEKIQFFEKQHPGINVEVVYYGAADQVNSKIMTALAGNEAPDLFWYGNMAAGQFAKTGKLVRIQDFIETDKEFDQEDIYIGLWDTTKYKGKIYAIPFEANNLALYYNKDHFKEVGLTSRDIKTWDHLLQAAKKLTTKDRFGFQVPLGNGEWTVWTWQTLLWQAGGDFLALPDYNKALFNSKAGANALQFLVDLVHKYKVANFSEPEAGYKTDQFVAGKISMMINGPWNFGVLENAKKEAGLNYGAIMLPRAGSYAALGGMGRKATNIGGENLYMFKSDKAKEAAAWELCKFLMSAEFQVDWAIKTGYLPVSKSATKNHEYVEFLSKNSFIKTYSEQMAFGKARPAIPEYSKISSKLGKEIEKALYKKISPQAALNNAATYTNKKLQ